MFTFINSNVLVDLSLKSSREQLCYISKISKYKIKILIPFEKKYESHRDTLIFKKNIQPNLYAVIQICLNLALESFSIISNLHGKRDFSTYSYAESECFLMRNYILHWERATSELKRWHIILNQ